jgi:predicted TIM-barrel enzyme
VETATAAEFFLSDGVIVNGSTTSKEPDANEVKNVKEEVNIPVIIGSGITVNNVGKYFQRADAFIVGSHLKKDGKWKNGVDSSKVKTFMEKINQVRK